jgi:hypothetical protein
MIMRGALLLLGALGGCGGAAVCPTGVPATLAPTSDARVAFVAHARGVQIYACDGATWKLVAPRADLSNDDGAVIGTHGAGPVWESSDGSRVRGAKRVSADVDAGAIPWLLVDIAAHEGAAGVMSEVTAIQRVHTTGGVAPATGCDAEHHDATVEVPYTADYVFYRRGGAGPRCS